MSTHAPANPVYTPELGALNRSIGVLFSGYTCSMVLYGFIFFQTYTYFIDYPNDPYPLKTLVALVAALDTVSVGVLTDALHTYIIVEFPVFTQAVETATATFTTDNGLAVVIIFLVQTFYAHRLVSLSGSYVVPAIVGVLSAASLVLGLVMTARMHTNPAFVSFASSPMKAIVGTCQGLAASASILTFISMAYFTARSPSVTLKAKPLFDQILIWLLVYGGAAAVVQLLYFAVFLGLPGRRDWMFFQTIARRLFAISLLTTLSYRENHRGKGTFEEQTVQRSAGGSSHTRSTLPPLSFAKSHAVPSPGVVVDRTVDMDTSLDLTSTMGYRGDEDTSISDKHGVDYRFTTSHN